MIREINIQTGVETQRLMTVEEQTASDVATAQWLVDKPLWEWKRKMAGTDSGMPRYLEDLITDNSNLIIHENMKTRYDEKIELRATKP